MYRDKDKMNKILARNEKDPKEVARQLYDFMEENKRLRKQCLDNKVDAIEGTFERLEIERERLLRVMKENGEVIYEAEESTEENDNNG